MKPRETAFFFSQKLAFHNRTEWCCGPCHANLAALARAPHNPGSRPSFSRVLPGMHSFHLYHCHLYRWIECIPGRTQQKNDGPRQGKCDSSCLNLFTVTVSSEKGTRSMHNALPAVAGWQCCSSRSTALRRPRLLYLVKSHATLMCWPSLVRHRPSDAAFCQLQVQTEAGGWFVVVVESTARKT